MVMMINKEKTIHEYKPKTMIKGSAYLGSILLIIALPILNVVDFLTVSSN
jgi:hypothetical protein